jgi:hypothetical protein
MQLTLSSHQAKSGEKSIKAKDMIAVQVTYKDVINFTESDPVFPHLHLGAFSAVY